MRALLLVLATLSTACLRGRGPTLPRPADVGLEWTIARVPGVDAIRLHYVLTNRSSRPIGLEATDDGDCLRVRAQLLDQGVIQLGWSRVFVELPSRTGDANPSELRIVRPRAALSGGAYVVIPKGKDPETLHLRVPIYVLDERGSVHRALTLDGGSRAIPEPD